MPLGPGGEVAFFKAQPSMCVELGKSPCLLLAHPPSLAPLNAAFSLLTLPIYFLIKKPFVRANCVTPILHPSSPGWGWAVSSLTVFSSDCCSNQLPAANCAFAWLDLLLHQPLISLKPPSWKTESFTGSAGITFSCGVPLQKSKWFLMRSLPSTLLFYRPPLLCFHYPLRSRCAAGWLPLQHLHLVPPSALCLGSINCSSNLIILICSHFAPLAYGSAQTKRSLSFETGPATGALISERLRSCEVCEVPAPPECGSKIKA